MDLSTGINPVPWPDAGKVAIDWHRLPDDEDLAALEREAALFFGTSPDRLCAVPGTEMALRALGLLGLPAPHHHVWPGYASHAAAFPTSKPVPWDQLGSDRQAGGTLLLANPANPTGAFLPPDRVRELAASIAGNGGWLIVDEAYVDAQPHGSVVPWLSADDPIIVLRSFGKFFGLAGVRLGFLIGPPDRLALLRDRMGSWPLSAAALVIGRAAYADSDWISATRTALAARARALDAVLARHGLQAEGASPLFRLLRCDAAIMFDKLARKAILTRPFDYARDWLRIGVPADAEALDRLDRALAHV